MAIEKERLSYLVALAILFVGFLALGTREYVAGGNRKINTEKHINLAITTGKMCSSCHFGASFVNLFNNKEVVGNDNVVFYILDEVKVKRW